MANPWDKYASQAKAPAPWEKYQGPALAPSESIASNGPTAYGYAQQAGVAPSTPEPEAQDISELESYLRGTAQNASFGFADEGTGAAEALYKKYQGDPRDLRSLYDQSRDESRANYKSAEAQNPSSYMAGQVTGAVAPALLTGGGAGIPSLMAQGAAQGLGSSEADLSKGNYKGAALDAAFGGGTGFILGAGGKLASYIPFAKAANYAGGKLNSLAEHLATNATGATGAQARKFAPDAGRQLLDRGLVKFGDSAENIAGRVGEASQESGEAIGAALKELDSMGVKSSIDNVRSVLEKKVAELSEAPGNEAVVRKIQKEIDNLYSRGQSDMRVSLGEQAKRNYQNQVNASSPEAAKRGSAQVASAFREETERAAQAADPEIAKAFKADKETFGLLAPIQEAAERRAMTLNQAPLGGLGDMVAGGVGGAPTVAAKRLAFPRISSSGAVLADNIGDVLKATPEMFGKFAAPLQAAAARGATSLAATNFVLQQTNPEYRSIVFGNENDDRDEK